MSKFGIGDPVSAQAELCALLDYNGLRYRREGDDFRFLFSDGGRKWLTVCRCREAWVGIYGVYPFPAEDEEKALALCSEINGKVKSGGMFLRDGAIVFRTGADLRDAYGAYEAIAGALEYNAAVVKGFWQTMALCAEKGRKSQPMQAIMDACPQE